LENSYYYHTRIGRILISEDGTGITRLSIVNIQEKEDGNSLRVGDIFETELIKETAKQLNEYLEGKRKSFDVKLNPKGTQFQRSVWKALQTIPYGETRSYKQIACAIGNEKATRAVGMANHNNPILCIIPCHRVIGTNGTLVGFGAGLDIKEQLLNLEAKYQDNK
jgi:methylated-DNA-[protein]-cysteine S-methyltransferase